MLSVVVTAWNESQNLPRLIHSVSSLADEIVVVDNGSTDNTAKIAKDLGCKVFHHPTPQVVEKLRNFSISKAKGDWILLLDADEEVSTTLADEIRRIISHDSADYARIPRQNLIFNQWIKSDHWWPDYVYRLFKKGHISWHDEIHSIPITTGRGVDFAALEKYAIIHHHYDSVAQYIDRLNRYTNTQAEELIKLHTQFHWTDLITKPTDEFLSQFFARRGFTQGLHGLALSLLQAFSALVLYLKLWQSSGFKPIDYKLKDLKSLATTKQKEMLWWYYQTKIESSSQATKPYWKLIRKLSLPTKS